MTWTGQAFSVGQVLTAAQMTNLQADITAVMNKDSGAPPPTTDFISAASMIAASVVGRSEITNSTTTSAGTINSGAELDFTLNDWALFPMIHGQNGDMDLYANSSDGGSGSAPRFRMATIGGSNRTYDVDHRWIITA